jgi:hypothetical protein
MQLKKSVLHQSVLYSELLDVFGRDFFTGICIKISSRIYFAYMLFGYNTYDEWNKAKTKNYVTVTCQSLSAHRSVQYD